MFGVRSGFHFHDKPVPPLAARWRHPDPKCIKSYKSVAFPHPTTVPARIKKQFRDGNGLIPVIRTQYTAKTT
eukprot:9490959-Pyramimonas_sp.AAC.1